MRANKEKCIDTDCKRIKWNDLQDMRIIPFEESTAETRKLFSYFLHNAPDIGSTQSQRIPTNQHSALFSTMITGRHFKYHKFCWFNAPIEKELAKGYMNGNKICLKCKRFVCKKKQTKKQNPEETDLDCFLRHIRNSIAHGRVYYYHAGNRIHIVFEDKNSSGNLSARIVCIKVDLEHLKYVLSNPANYQ